MHAKKLGYFLAAMTIMSASAQVFANSNEGGTQSGSEGGTASTSQAGAGGNMAQKESSTQNRSSASTENNSEHGSSASSESGLVPVGGGPAVPAIPSGVPKETVDAQDAHAWGAPKTEPATKSAAPGASHAAAPKHSAPVTKTYHWKKSK